VNDQPDVEMAMPCSNTLEYHEEEVQSGEERVNKGYYEIVLPTVRQVARNQFNCQKLIGARLENQPTAVDCIGSHFDERFFFTEFMSAVYDDDAAYFSPLTLALLEDTGWYKVDFRHAENSPFGLGAGCEFVTGNCIVEEQVPVYGRGFFCNDLEIGDDWSCGPSHHYKGRCDLKNYVFPKRTYFEASHMGPSFTHADYCPLIVSDTTDCDNVNAKSSHAIEFFGPDSKCIDVTTKKKKSSACVKSSCNPDTQSFDFEVGGSIYSCDENFKVIKDVTISGVSYTFDCPRLTQVCPTMFCPAMCSGKGVCNWSLPKPACECFDKNDKTDGCYDSPVNEASRCTGTKPSIGFKIHVSLIALSLPIIALAAIS